jgi:hypothetical protein
MIFLAGCKMRTPPDPILKFDGITIPIIRGSYDWNGTHARSAPISILAKDAVPTKLQPNSTIEVRFKRTPQFLGVLHWNLKNYNEKEFIKDKVEDNLIYLPRISGTYAYEIYTEWKWGQIVHYFFIEIP